MVTQTMGSDQGVGVGVGVGDSSTSKSPYLSRQGSLYSLTLDEFQNHLGNVGKPLGNMNLDELVRNVWTVEAKQSLGNMNVENGAQNLLQALVGESSFCLSRDLSRKTVEEVWREIQECKKNDSGRNPDRQNTLGEMTLEDFLVQAGVSADDGPGNAMSITGQNSQGVVDLNAGRGQSSVSQHAQWMEYQLLPQQQQQHGMMPMVMQGLHVSPPIPDSEYPDTQLASPLVGALSDTQTANRKRVAPGVVVEKTLERRQKRMIKNRESAARSRARRQAYTHELENKVSRLEEENERLRRMREVEKVVPSVPPPQPMHQLRRTSSTPF